MQLRLRLDVPDFTDNSSARGAEEFVIVILGSGVWCSRFGSVRMFLRPDLIENQLNKHK